MDEYVLRCAVILGKTQHQIEHEYAWIDLPRLIEISTERRASELLENIEVSAFPHMADAKVREAILKRHLEKVPTPPPTPPPAPPKSAQEQYEALKLRMKGR